MRLNLNVLLKIQLLLGGLFPNAEPLELAKDSMWDNKGNFWKEPNYKGYGMFCKKDCYILVAEMNNIYEDTVSDEKKDQMVLILNLVLIMKASFFQILPRLKFGHGEITNLNVHFIQ